MHGRVVEVFVAAGEDVSMGERLAIVEAMKMQHEIIAQIDGTVAEVLVAGDQQVAADDLMIRIDANDAEGN
jgi:geranyl-CoA carboxylase alpha subunit